MCGRPPLSPRAYTLVPYTTLFRSHRIVRLGQHQRAAAVSRQGSVDCRHVVVWRDADLGAGETCRVDQRGVDVRVGDHEDLAVRQCGHDREVRSEEHTSELQSLMRISYAVFCLKKKKTHKKQRQNNK